MVCCLVRWQGWDAGHTCVYMPTSTSARTYTYVYAQHSSAKHTKQDAPDGGAGREAEGQGLVLLDLALLGVEHREQRVAVLLELHAQLEGAHLVCGGVQLL